MLLVVLIVYLFTDSIRTLRRAPFLDHGTPIEEIDDDGRWPVGQVGWGPCVLVVGGELPSQLRRIVEVM
jgi:hypothetical protein